MIVESAAGRTIAKPERQGRPRPKVTDQEVIVVELPLSAPAVPSWTSIFERKVEADRPAQVGWVHVDNDLTTQTFAVTFKLDDQQNMLAAVDALDAMIAATTQEWLALPDVAEKIAKQQRIDRLQAFLDRVAEA